jgi:ribonuclease HI
VSEPEFILASDGSSHQNGFGGPMGWAWARNDGAWMSRSWFTGSNQRAELMAILAVLMTHPKIHIRVQMDSQYALNVTEKWSVGWEKRGWTKPDNKPIANLDIIKPIRELMDLRTIPIEFEWVKGHLKTNAHPLNTMADIRAGEASERAKKATNALESLPLYLDSKGRTELPADLAMMKRIYEL